MASLQEQFELAFTEIMLGETGQHLLEADAVTGCVVNGESVTITLDLPTDQGLRSAITGEVESRIGKIPGISSITVRMADQTDQAGNGGQDTSGAAPGSPEAPQGPQRPEKQAYLQNYDAVIAVASGKGGVGKSTVAVNLALSLARMGKEVSLFDADIYGPSVPIMMGMRNAKPNMVGEQIAPLEKYGISMMSIGNLVEESAATIWRGPIVHQVLDQILRDTRWPGGDFMIIDMPPGTGDTQLTISQLLELAGVVIVSTPQDVAMLDAMKGVAMFEKVEVPVLGLVENMSSFICPECQHETPIFDKGSAEKAAGQHNIAFLGRIPIEMAIREGGDNGIPVASATEENATTRAFTNIALKMIERLNQQ